MHGVIRHVVRGKAPGDAWEAARHFVSDKAEEVAVYTAPGRWLLAEGYLKPFAGVRHTHYGAAAALRLHPSVGYRLEAVRSIRLITYGDAIQYCGGRSPRRKTAPVTPNTGTSSVPSAAVEAGTRAISPNQRA